MKRWYVDSYYADWWAKMKRAEAEELGKDAHEDWPFAVYLAADLEVMKAKVGQLPIYTTVCGSGMNAQIVKCFLINDVIALFEEGK